MKITGKAKNFQEMLALVTYKGGGEVSFPLMPVIVEKNEKDEGHTLYCRAIDDKQTIVIVSEWYGFEVEKEDDEDDTFVLDTVGLIDIFNKLFDGADDVSLEIADGLMTIVGPKDEMKMPLTDVKNIKLMKKIPFVIKEDKMTYKKGTIEPSAVIKTNATVLKDIISRGNLVNVEQYNLSFSEDGLSAIIGNPKDPSTRSISSEFTEIDVDILDDKESVLNVILSQNFRRVFTAVDGEVVLSGRTDMPLWVMKYGQDYKLGIQLTNRRNIE